MPKNNEKSHAVEMRSQGHSLSYISQKIGVSRSTLSHWLRDMPFTPNETTISGMKSARSKSAVSRNRRRIESIFEMKKTAASDLGQLTERDFFMIGLGMLAKSGRVTASGSGGSSASGGSNERIEMMTADAKLARLFMLWIEKGLKVPIDHVFGRLTLSSSANPDAMLRFWSETLKLPIGQLKVSYIDRRRAVGNARFSSAPFGSMKIYIKNKGRTDLGVLLHRKILASIDRVLAS